MPEKHSSLSSSERFLQRSLTLLENAFSVNSNGGELEENRFWDKLLLSRKNLSQNRELLDAYEEARNRVTEQQQIGSANNCDVERSSEELLEEDECDESLLFYELALDERTRPICDLYGMMSNLMLQLESAAAFAACPEEYYQQQLQAEHEATGLMFDQPCHYQPFQASRQYQRGIECVSSSFQACQYQRALEQLLLYLKSLCSVLLPQKRRALIHRIKSAAKLLAAENVKGCDWDIDEKVGTSDQSLAVWLSQFHGTQPDLGAPQETCDDDSKSLLISSSDSSVSEAAAETNTSDRENKEQITGGGQTTYEDQASSSLAQSSGVQSPTGAAAASDSVTTTTPTQQKPASTNGDEEITGSAAATAAVAVASLCPAVLRLSKRVGGEDRERVIDECQVDEMALAEVEAQLFPTLRFKDGEGGEICDGDLATIGSIERRIIISGKVSDGSRASAAAAASRSSDQKSKAVTFHSAAAASSHRRHRKPSAPRTGVHSASAEDEKSEQESLTTSIGETANKLRVLAYQSRDIIIKDKKRLLEATTVQDNYLHETQKSYAISSQLAWTGSLSFFQELIMGAAAIACFLIVLSFISSTIMIA